MEYIMRYRKIKIAAITTLFLFASNVAIAASIKNLTILAEPNMVTALTKIARIYSQKNSVIVSISFASSSDLINDIDAGEPADIFISAHKDWINNLKQKGLVDIYSINHVASDGLALVTSKNNTKIPEELINHKLSLENALKILDQNHLVLIVDNDGSSLGQYSQDLLALLQLSNIKIFEKLHEDKMSVFGLIEENPDNYTITLSSQAQDRDGLKILSGSQNQNIFYQALVIAGDNMEAAREFSRFLQTAQARAIFKQSGFLVD